MQAFRKTALTVALSLTALGAMAGEIAQTNVTANGVSNTTIGVNSRALQNIGVAEGNSRIQQSTIIVNGARNLSVGANSTASQSIGHTTGNGQLLRTTVSAQKNGTA